MQQTDIEMAPSIGLLILKPKLIQKILEFLDYNQFLQFRTVSQNANQITQIILNKKLKKINKEVKRLQDLMYPIRIYVYGEMNADLNNDFMKTLMNIINAANQIDFKSKEFKDAIEKDPVGIKIFKYLKLLFKDNYEISLRFQVQAISEEQFAEVLQILELEEQINQCPSICKKMYQLFLDIIKLRSMRFMNEWHKQYKIDIQCYKWIEKQSKIEFILARIRQTEIEKNMLRQK